MKHCYKLKLQIGKIQESSADVVVSRQDINGKALCAKSLNRSWHGLYRVFKNAALSGGYCAGLQCRKKEKMLPFQTGAERAGQGPTSCAQLEPEINTEIY